MARVRRAILQLWNAARQILAVRGLLQWSGKWETVTAALGSGSLGAWARLEHLPGPLIGVIVLFAFVLLSALWRLWKPQKNSVAGSKRISEVPMTRENPKLTLLLVALDFTYSQREDLGLPNYATARDPKRLSKTNRSTGYAVGATFEHGQGEPWNNET